MNIDVSLFRHYHWGCLVLKRTNFVLCGDNLIVKFQIRFETWTYIVFISTWKLFYLSFKSSVFNKVERTRTLTLQPNLLVGVVYECFLRFVFSWILCYWYMPVIQLKTVCKYCYLVGTNFIKIRCKRVEGVHG